MCIFLSQYFSLVGKECLIRRACGVSTGVSSSEQDKSFGNNRYSTPLLFAEVKFLETPRKSKTAVSEVKTLWRK
jgi:hypothetical protein